jgi:hypothetical protein
MLTASSPNLDPFLSGICHINNFTSSLSTLQRHLESIMTVRCSGTPQQGTFLFQPKHQMERQFTATIAPQGDNASDGKGVDIFTESLQRKIELELQQLPRFDKEQGHTNDDASVLQADADVNTEANNQKSRDGTSRDSSYTSKDVTREVGGPKGPEPTRYGDWERGGRCSDF